MTKMLKVALLFSGTLALVACDSGTSTAAPAAKTEAKGSAPAAKDWTTVVVETPEGGFRMGNPDARVKLVEFASFTCSHCRDFHKEAEAKLKPDYVKSGQVSYEYRPFMLNIYDFAATQLATCQGPEKFFTWAGELFNNHDAWIEPFTKLTEADITPLRNQSMGKQVLGLATAGKFNSFAAARGVPRAKFDACLSDEAKIEALTKRQQAAIDAYQIQGTPTFVLNGKKVENAASWAQLQPKIAEAL
ncbi:DsbA family protein [Sandaracinobacter sp. RS1-74]|uniref:thioredoxin domain-containing protein n=1 Tax=Sandaracinobacteroides sayramensis TaxID=2913411 RepID=UPI001EDAF54A|nr:thioredoxin domain-containing protein [Sandaracinobacteroides sayramensis]MCG2840282.1 DsbA family protein [Sandaracinobacteroides sayramensis]